MYLSTGSANKLHAYETIPFVRVRIRSSVRIYIINVRYVEDDLKERTRAIAHEHNLLNFRPKTQQIKSNICIFGMEINSNSSAHTHIERQRRMQPHTGSFSRSQRFFHSACLFRVYWLDFSQSPTLSHVLFLCPLKWHCVLQWRTLCAFHFRLLFTFNIYLLISQYAVHMLTTLCVIFCVSSRENPAHSKVLYKVVDQYGGRHCVYDEEKREMLMEIER